MWAVDELPVGARVIEDDALNCCTSLQKHIVLTLRELNLISLDDTHIFGGRSIVVKFVAVWLKLLNKISSE